MNKLFETKINLEKIFYIFFIYSILGILINFVFNGKFFSFLYNFGFDNLIHFIFKDNISFVGKYIYEADINFYYLYFSFFIFILGIYLIKNSYKIIFRKNFLMNSIEEKFVKKDNIGLKIIVACALSLFLELSIIRIHSSYIHFFSFLKNISLISCFLGLGIGYSLRRFKLISLNWIFPLLFLQIVMIYFLSNTPVSTALLNPILERMTMGQDTAETFIHLILIYLFIIFIFIFNALCFVPIGHLIARLMNNVNNLRAYGFNLLGSLLGIIVFIIFSFLQTSPLVWIIFSFLTFLYLIRFDIRKYYLSILSILILTIILSLDIKNKNNTIYSPYQNITIEHLNNPLNPVIIKTSHFFYQAVLNLSNNLSNLTDNIAFGNIMGPGVDIIHEREFYELPYLINEKKPKKVLIVGSGSGNDVAAANRHEIKKIHAVEIDPVIVKLGKKFHPERPYNSERVDIIIDDARSFINKSEHKYDLIVYGLLDSQMNLSSKGGIRLDSYVYTIEAFNSAKNKLTEDGYIAISFFAQTTDIAFKIYEMLSKTFSHDPMVLKSEINNRYFFAISKKENLNFSIDELKFFKKTSELQKINAQIDLSTDDWPFLYMPKKIYPISYLIIVIVLTASSFFFLKNLTPLKKNNFSFTCFYLGAGFMLIETKCITEFAKIFGTTWLVNALVISAILLMAFFANYLVIKKIKMNIILNYFLIFLSIFFGYYLFTKTNLSLDIIFYPLMLTLPILFSGIAFSREILKIESTSQALYANILGAMFGGFLEYNSMYFGLSSLYFLAILLYFFAFLTSNYFRISYKF